jgi:hypothetical protein
MVRILDQIANSIPRWKSCCTDFFFIRREPVSQVGKELFANPLRRIRYGNMST